MEQKKFDICDRTFDFSVRIINIFRALDKHQSENFVLGKQLIRSGTSVGAMCEEARSAESTPDFIQKYSIALKEARETLYWLRLFVATNIFRSISYRRS